MSMYHCDSLVMMLGSSHSAAANSSHMYPSVAYFAMYCATGFGDFAISAIIAFVKFVLTEVSTVVSVILCQGAVRTMCTASGSHQRLNSRRCVCGPSDLRTSDIDPPMKTSS